MVTNKLRRRGRSLLVIVDPAFLKSVRMVGFASLYAAFDAFGGPFRALRPPSDALLHGACLSSKGYQFRQPHEVVGGAAEDEQPIDLVQSAQLHLADRAGLLEPSKSLFDQPSAAQADGVAGMPRGSAVEVRSAPRLG